MVIADLELADLLVDHRDGHCVLALRKLLKAEDAALKHRKPSV